VNFSSLSWRSAEPSDSEAVIAAIDAWWPGLHMVHAVCPQLFQHFGDTCVLVEDGDQLIGFLVGLMSQRMPQSGYIHYAGVHRDRRGAGLGRQLYERFAQITRERGRSELFAETGAWNTKSIAFHTTLGFSLTPGDVLVDGIPVHRDTTGHGFDYVEMVLRLDGGEVAS
jgi:GNAT superfamily N-acetyltransferase